MIDAALTTKERLIRAAASLFSSRGYASVGVAEILSLANAPKGSLYHHFPDGKSDLAIAAATWASHGILRVIASAFADATDFRHGMTTLCYKLAKLFDKSGQWDGCPVSATLFDGPANQVFRDHANHLFEGWIAEAALHGERLGLSETAAHEAAESMFLLIQGGWQLARARGDAAVLRSLPNQLLLPGST